MTTLQPSRRIAVDVRMYSADCVISAELTQKSQGDGTGRRAASNRGREVGRAMEEELESNEQ